MKNNLFTILGLWICFSLLGTLGHAQTTSLTVGAIKNRIGTITNLSNATHVLIANLPEGSSVSDLKLEYSEYESKYYLTGKVSGSAYSSVGIQLVLSGNTLTAFSGPGVELTCTGSNCSDCRISFEGGRPHCKCFRSEGSDPKCDMTSKITISL